MIALPDSTLIRHLIEACDARFGTCPIGQSLGGHAALARDAVMLRALADAWADVSRLLGPDPARWAWGKLLHAFFEHPLSRHASPELARKLNVGPGPKGGSGQTLNAATYFAANFRIHYGCPGG
jgi:penicillin amidase